MEYTVQNNLPTPIYSCKYLRYIDTIKSPINNFWKTTVWLKCITQASGSRLVES